MKQKTLTLIFLWILSVGYFLIIMSFSAAPAADSSTNSKNITKKIVELCDSVIGRKSTPKEVAGRVTSLHGFVRKCAHVYNFALLGIANCLLFFVASDGNIRKAVVIALLFGLCGAVLDEFSQLFVEGRAGQLKDVFIDFTGTSQSCLVFFVFGKILKKEGRIQ